MNAGSAVVTGHEERRIPPVRPEIELPEVAPAGQAEIERVLPLGERLMNLALVRRLLILAVLAAAWEGYAIYVNNPLMFPRFSDVCIAFVTDCLDGTLPERAWTTLNVLLLGYAAGIVCAAVFTTLAVTTRIGTDLLALLTSMFNPLPAIALLPLALLWIGLGVGSLVFVIVHSVVWSVALNAYSGFRAVSPTLRMVGRNYGLTGANYVVRILIPAALPSIVSGLKVGWAFSWRTLIAAELVFGVSAGKGGLGWYIFEYKTQLMTDHVFAGLLAVIIIGLLIDAVVFRFLEERTVQRWGMQ